MNRRRELGSLVVAAVAVIVGVGPVIPSLRADHRAAALALAGTYLALLVAGGLTSTTGRRKAVVLVLQSALVLGLVLLSDGAAGLVAMPLLSAIAVETSAKMALLVGAFFVALIGALGLRHGVPPTTVVQTLGTDGAAAAFVVAFSRLMAGERAAREHVERLATELEAANAKLVDNAARIESLATIAERNRIARDIHDGLGHCLTVVNMQLEAARKLLPGEPQRALECAERAQAMTRQGLDEVRRSVAVLRDADDGVPLFDAIREIASVCRSDGLAVDLSLHGEPRALAQPIRTALYRTAQEALTNTRRHAEASVAKVRLAFDREDISLEIQDDGKGTGDASGGFGLLGIRERVQQVGGSVEVRTAPGAGFTVSVRVPA